MSSIRRHQHSPKQSRPCTPGLLVRLIIYGMSAMDRKIPSTTALKHWYVARWPPLAWLETVIKLAALVTALVTFTDTLFDGSFDFPRGTPLVQFLILVVPYPQKTP
jgi:hypothetical protein